MPFCPIPFDCIQCNYIYNLASSCSVVQPPIFTSHRMELQNDVMSSLAETCDMFQPQHARSPQIASCCVMLFHAKTTSAPSIPLHVTFSTSCNNVCQRKHLCSALSRDECIVMLCCGKSHFIFLICCAMTDVGVVMSYRSVHANSPLESHNMERTCELLRQ